MGEGEISDQSEQALTPRGFPSRGGFSAKIHILVDALANQLRFILSGGQRHDSTQAEALIESYQFQHMIADRGYDTNPSSGNHWNELSALVA